ncbi:MAG: DUF2283 domain-containing protein [Chloroflexi bacterium]|nr:DUF2283 domain-containing protein [Chloroflexota bacterium]
MNRDAQYPFITYDPAADAAYVYLAPIQPGDARSLGRARRTDGTELPIMIDFSRATGTILGIEILSATSLLGPIPLSFAVPPGQGGDAESAPRSSESGSAG